MKACLNTLMGQATRLSTATQPGFPFFPFLSLVLTVFVQQTVGLVLRLMTRFARDFVAVIEGTNVDISTKELSGGAGIYYIFNDVFGHALASIEPTHNLDNQDIRTAIRNSTGLRPSLFVPEFAFDLLVKPQIRLSRRPVCTASSSCTRSLSRSATTARARYCCPFLLYLFVASC